MKTEIKTLVGLMLMLTAGHVFALGGTGLTAYGTYWDGENAGYGAGLRYSRSLLDMVSVDGRAGYIRFDDYSQTEMVPLEVAFNLGIPGPVSPYVGVGLGYYLVDHPLFDDTSGCFGQLGLEFTVLKIGAMVELRYMDLDEHYFDDLSLNAGIVLKF